MTIEFKENVPDCLVGEYQDPASQNWHCVVVIKSLDAWSAYIDGNLVGNEFQTKVDAKRSAVGALELRSRQNKRKKFAFMGVSVFFILAITVTHFANFVAQ